MSSITSRAALFLAVTSLLTLFGAAYANTPDSVPVGPGVVTSIGSNKVGPNNGGHHGTSTPQYLLINTGSIMLINTGSKLEITN